MLKDRGNRVKPAPSAEDLGRPEALCWKTGPMEREREVGNAAAAASRERRMMPATTTSDSRPAAGAALHADTARASAAAPVQANTKPGTQAGYKCQI